MRPHRRLAMAVPIAGLIAVLAAAPTASAKPKPKPTTTTTTTTVPITTEPPTTAPTPTPTTQTCWSPASEPVTVDTTWSASNTTESCTYRFDYLSGWGKVMFSTDAWIWFYQPAVDPTDPVAFSYAGIQWTFDHSSPNGIACGEAGSCDGVPLEEDPY